MCDVAARLWSVRWEPFPHDSELLNRTESR
jgi:hypothetical protein